MSRHRLLTVWHVYTQAPYCLLLSWTAFFFPDSDNGLSIVNAQWKSDKSITLIQNENSGWILQLIFHSTTVTSWCVWTPNIYQYLFSSASPYFVTWTKCSKQQLGSERSEPTVNEGAAPPNKYLHLRREKTKTSKLWKKSGPMIKQRCKW